MCVVIKVHQQRKWWLPLFQRGLYTKHIELVTGMSLTTEPRPLTKVGLPNSLFITAQD